ncbi:MAG: Rid family hydrolase [Actinomycetota bacterium]
MANRTIDPDGVAPPAAHYAHAVVSDAGSRLLHTSGVVPIAPDGSVPETVEAQAEVVWANIGLMLADAGMDAGDVVSVTTYVVADELDLSGVMAARDRALDGRRAASTLVTVPRLARPEWRMEIAVVASRSDS